MKQESKEDFHEELYRLREEQRANQIHYEEQEQLILRKQMAITDAILKKNRPSSFSFSNTKLENVDTAGGSMLRSTSVTDLSVSREKSDLMTRPFSLP
eukprot:Awhi_evm2s5936